MTGTAQRLAETLEDEALFTGLSRREHLDYKMDAATELRRLSAINIELLEALKKCLYVVEDNLGDRYWLVQQAARAAIAKAEGK